MRFRNGLVLAITAAVLIPGALQAEEKKSETTRNSNSVVTKKNTATKSNTNTTANTTTQPTSEEEKKLFAQLRGYQLLLQKEEQALAQRMAYAQKLRAAGLEKNDQKILDQAEEYERRAMDYYTKRVQQFEKMRFTTPSTEATQPTTGTSQPAVRNQQPTRSQSNRSASNYSRRRRGR
jgi:hypothetical protein